MSDFYNDAKTRKARKERPCIYCGEPIGKGDTYTFQSGNFDGSWYDNHYHQECFDDLAQAGFDEFTPYSGERPKEAIA